MESWCGREPVKKEGESEISSGFRFLLAMPIDQLFRLVVDGDKQKSERGFVGFEGREKLSVQSFLKALLEADDFINQDQAFSVHFYKLIHKICRENLPLAEVPGGEFITHPEHGFHIPTISVEGLKDLCIFAKKYPEIDPSLFVNGERYSLTQSKVNRILLKCQNANLHGQIYFDCLLYMISITTEDCEHIANQTINHLNAALATATNDNEIIHAIVDCAYDLEHLHPYKDVNLRSIMNVINILLMKYDFPPVVYDNPNNLDGFSKNEFFDLIKHGMLMTLNIIENPNYDYFGFNVAELDEQEKLSYANFINPIKAELDKRKDNHPVVSKHDLVTTRERINKLNKFDQADCIFIDGKFDYESSNKFLDSIDKNRFDTRSFRTYPNNEVINHSARLFHDVQEENEATDEYSPVSFYREAIREWLNEGLDDKKMFENICELGMPSVEIENGITLLSLAIEVGVSNSVIDELKKVAIANPEGDYQRP